MSCPPGLVVIDYSCGLLHRETGDCIRGLPCPPSGQCCEWNPIAIAILGSSTMFCLCCCCPLIIFCIYRMCCATSQSSVPSAQPQPMQGQPQVIVLQQGAPMAGQVQQVDQNGNPIMVQQVDQNGNPIMVQQVDQNGNPIVAPVQQVDQFGNPIMAPTVVDQFGKPVAAQVQSTPGQVDKAGNPIAENCLANPIADNTQANPIDQKNDPTGDHVNDPTAE